MKLGELKNNERELYFFQLRELVEIAAMARVSPLAPSSLIVNGIGLSDTCLMNTEK